MVKSSILTNGGKTDQIIWDDFLSGDNDAYAYIYKEYSQALYAYGLHFTTDIQLVEDCIHDVFVKIYRSKAKLQSTDNIKFYLFMAMKNSLYNIFRDMIHYNPIDTQELVFATEYTIEDEFIDKEETRHQKEQVEKMLKILTSRQKEVIFYRFVEGMAYDEISELMNMTAQSVKNLLQRSLKKIRDYFPNMKIETVATLIMLIPF